MALKSTLKERHGRHVAALFGLLIIPLGSSCSFMVDTEAGVECRTNTDCGSETDYTICKRAAGTSSGTCVKLKSNECTTVYGDWRNDNAFLFGSIFPTTGIDKSTGLARENAVKLAIDDIQKNASGLPAIPGQEVKKRRPLAFVGCSDDSNQKQGVRAARHLVENIGVPVIIGAAWSGVTMEIATKVTVDKGTLLISPSATAPSITSLEDNGLVWRTSPSDVYQGMAMAKYMNILEKNIRSSRSIDEAQKIKVAVVYPGGSAGIGLKEALINNAELAFRLAFNKAPATAAENAHHYMAFDYGDPSGPASELRYREAVEKILNFEPDVVFDLCAAEGILHILQPTEQEWASKNPGSPAPYWVLNDAGQIRELWEEVVATNNDLRKRITGTVPGSENDQFQVFKHNYIAADFGDNTDPAVFGPAGSFDAVYMIAYAAVALGSKPITGANLADAFSFLIPHSEATSIDIGVFSLNSAFQILHAGRRIDINGASGPLDFDLATGEAPSDIQVWCMPKNESGMATSAQFSGLYLDASTKELKGDIGDICRFD